MKAVYRGVSEIDIGPVGRDVEHRPVDRQSVAERRRFQSQRRHIADQHSRCHVARSPRKPRRNQNGSRKSAIRYGREFGDQHDAKVSGVVSRTIASREPWKRLLNAINIFCFLPLCDEVTANITSIWDCC